MADLRNDLAKARDAWLDSQEGVECCAGTCSHQYLRNRLERAFIAGWNARHYGATRAEKALKELLAALLED